MTNTRVAIALFVKNEFSDISGWIAWHFGIGAKTLFIFDDHSTDGTWDIIQSAAKSMDIRAERTDVESQPDFYWRQRDCFMKAAAFANGHYDWIGFLDGDEYVYFREAESLPQFLSRFPHADGVVLNWRIHGSSNRVVRPRKMAVEAFPQHSTPDLGDNVLVKSFVRPDRMGSKYHTPHWFDVPTERYARADGRYVEKESPIQDIDWNDAFVLHYICRSMEHYVQRIKRRLNADLTDSIGYWTHFDRNDVSDYEPFRFLPKLRRFQVVINKNSAIRAIDILRDGNLPSQPFADDDPQEPPRRVVRIRSCAWNSVLCINLVTREVFHADEDVIAAHGLVPLCGAIFSDVPQNVTLFVAGYSEGDSDQCLLLSGDDRIFSELHYQVMKIGDAGESVVALRSTLSRQYICFLPPGRDGIGKVEVSRNAPQAWEHAHLSSVIGTHERGEIDPPLLGATEPTFDTLVSWLRSQRSAPDVYRFLRLIAALTDEDRARLYRAVPGLLWAFI